VLVALELAGGGRVKWQPPPSRPRTAEEATVLRGLAGEPATLDDVIVRTGLATVDAVQAVRALEARGVVRRERGFLWPC
jgi:hypothetical protein